MRIRVEIGWTPPFEVCGHRHTVTSRARDCAYLAAKRLGSDAVRLIFVDEMSVQRHVEFWNGARVAGEPWDPRWRDAQPGGSR